MLCANGRRQCVVCGVGRPRKPSLTSIFNAAEEDDEEDNPYAKKKLKLTLLDGSELGGAAASRAATATAKFVAARSASLGPIPTDKQELYKMEIDWDALAAVSCVLHPQECFRVLMLASLWLPATHVPAHDQAVDCGSLYRLLWRGTFSLRARCWCGSAANGVGGRTRRLRVNLWTL